ncbi:hypothetical protein GGR51DRAFT_62650 [Nemania sp. FL0031]|nr:hypothetical protein GGR51DRAFT_62650 [Nemania sp. FL0031]
MEQKPTPPLNRNSLLPVPTQGAEEATQRASKEPENQAADSGPKKEKAPGKTNKPSKHSRTSDTESDEEVASRNARKKRKQESSLAKQSRSNTDGGDIDIEDVEEAFIFEYPHNSSLLWIVRCALCDFSPKRHPLIFTTSAFMHWNARGHPNVTAQDLLESHLVRGMSTAFPLFAWHTRRPAAQKACVD